MVIVFDLKYPEEKQSPRMLQEAETFGDILKRLVAEYGNDTGDEGNC